MQLKTTLRIYFTPVRFDAIQNTNNNVGEDAEEKGPFYTAGGNII
jgi:hypothetical protein